MNEIDIIKLEFLTRISKTMEARGMTATVLARKAKVSHSGVFRVLSGAVGLSFTRAYQLANALGLEFYSSGIGFLPEISNRDARARKKYGIMSANNGTVRNRHAHHIIRSA